MPLVLGRQLARLQRELISVPSDASEEQRSQGIAGMESSEL